MPSLKCVHKKCDGVIFKCEELSIFYAIKGTVFAFVEIEKDPVLSHWARGCGEDQVASSEFATPSHLHHLLAELLSSSIPEEYGSCSSIRKRTAGISTARVHCFEQVMCEVSKVVFVVLGSADKQDCNSTESGI